MFFLTKVDNLQWIFLEKFGQFLQYDNEFECQNLEITSAENVQKNFNALFVICGVFWKVFIKFHWHVSKFAWAVDCHSFFESDIIQDFVEL